MIIVGHLSAFVFLLYTRSPRNCCGSAWQWCLNTNGRINELTDPITYDQLSVRTDRSICVYKLELFAFLNEVAAG